MAVTMEGGYNWFVIMSIVGLAVILTMPNLRVLLAYLC